MRISINSATELVDDIVLIEPRKSTEASQYITSNYNTLLSYCHKLLGNRERAEDLLQDVVLSVLKSESEYNGFDSNYGDGTMNVAQFVASRIKLYAKNERYSGNCMESGKQIVYGKETEETVLTDAFGNVIRDKNGEVKTSVVTRTTKTVLKVNALCASYDEGSDAEDKDSFQKAFETASVSDTTDEINDKCSIRDEIDFCIDICELHNIKIIHLFRNIKELGNSITAASKKNGEAVFNGIRELASEHSEFYEAFVSVINFSKEHSDDFENIMNKYYAIA